MFVISTNSDFARWGVRRQKSPVQEQVSSAQMRHLAGVTHSADLVHTAVGHSADLVHAQDGVTVPPTRQSCPAYKTVVSWQSCPKTVTRLHTSPSYLFALLPSGLQCCLRGDSGIFESGALKLRYFS